MKVASFRDVGLSYVEKGSGTSVLLIHGSLNDYRSWKFQIDALATRYHVVAYSRRNHFPNGWIDYPADYSVEVERDDLVGLINALGLKTPVHLVGSSYGAFVAALVGRDYPKLVRSVVLGEPPIVSLLAKDSASRESYLAFERKFADMVLRPLRNSDYESAARGFIDSIMGAGTFNRLPTEAQEMMLQNSRSLVAELPTPESDPFTTEDAMKISAPTLLVGGQRSLPMFQTIMARLAQSLPHATVVTIRDSSHAPYSTNPPLYNKTVLNFLLNH